MYIEASGGLVSSQLQMPLSYLLWIPLTGEFYISRMGLSRTVVRTVR